ncbi:MFS transporter [Streptomyces calidiresistens]|uniref:MFS transporter n=1 Tax=Streptomyces calidiresistens TaxID=1485586 RepID=A0A7W3T0W4_9ACTN|nr:MFS transporter [Streptomyces calidiresistens]MBB0228858.1 MFS transporter [Streptomyces calidiresistens]
MTTDGEPAIDRPPTAPAPAREPLGRSYRLLWTASGLSNLADGVAKLALPLAAAQLTRSPAAVAGVVLALTLPWLLFALPVGVFVDRLDRRRLMLGANLLRGALLALLVAAVALGLDSIWALYAIALGLGTAETVYDTAAQSILPRVVRRDQLSRANGRLYAVELSANEFVGPPLSGFLVAAGVIAAFAAPGVLWLVAVVVLWPMRGSFRVGTAGPGAGTKPGPAPEPGPASDGRRAVRERRLATVGTEIAEGLRFVWRSRLLRTFAMMTGAFNLATSAVMAIIVLFAVGSGSPMGLSEPAFGVLLATMAGGSVVGSFLVEGMERRFGRVVLIFGSVLTGALMVGTPALTTNPFVIGAAFVLGGVGVVASNVVMVSLRQRITPDRLLGRVNSAYRLVAWGTRPLGALLGGLVAEVWGLRAVFAVTAVVMLSLLTGMTVVRGQALEDAEREAAERERIEATGVPTGDAPTPAGPPPAGTSSPGVTGNGP